MTDFSIVGNYTAYGEYTVQNMSFKLNTCFTNIENFSMLHICYILTAAAAAVVAMATTMKTTTTTYSLKCHI